MQLLVTATNRSSERDVDVLERWGHVQEWNDARELVETWPNQRWAYTVRQILDEEIDIDVG